MNSGIDQTDLFGIVCAFWPDFVDRVGIVQLEALDVFRDWRRVKKFTKDLVLSH